jgi:hypothetical protein
MDSSGRKAVNFLVLQHLCIHIFEGALLDEILTRWFTYAPLHNSDLRANLTEVIRCVCLAGCRLEITPTHIQIFDCEILKIPVQILNKHPHVIQLLERIFQDFARINANLAQRDIFLQGYAFNDVLDSVLSRESLLTQILNRIYRDSIRASALPQIRDMVIGILTDLYRIADNPGRKLLISGAIEKSKPTKAILNGRGGFSNCPFLVPSCILVDAQYCWHHGTYREFAVEAQKLTQSQNGGAGGIRDARAGSEARTKNRGF